MNLQETIEGIPSKVSELFKGWFSSHEQKMADALQAATDAKALLATAEKDRYDLKARAALLEATNTTQTTRITALETELATANTRITELEKNQKSVEQVAAEKSQQACAAQGITADKVPPDAGAGATTEAQLTEQFNAITDPKARGEFYQKHFESRWAKKK